jgi:AraC family transcriptional activator of pobA
MDGCGKALHNSNIAAGQSRPMSLSLPTYALYGETGQAPRIDWLHIESIADRSRLNDWEIRPHRHESLFQILYIASGACDVTLDAVATRLRGPGIVTIPALAVHGFRFSPDVQGVVVTVLEPHLQRLLAAEPSLKDDLLQARRQRLPRAHAAGIARAVQALRDEYARPSPWRGLAMDVALLGLALRLGRHLPHETPPPAARGQRGLDHVRRFRELVDERFREQPLLTRCAAELGITATQLNRACHQVLGHGALAVLHARLALEAQRELAYTALSVKQIGLGLGFADAAYFSRFFQRATGRTPSAWRAETSAAARR